MVEDAYSGARVRRSLIHFFSGKFTSALIGFLILMLLVRALSREEYGAYVAFLALFEILQLGGNLGCLPAVFRYVPEFRSRNEIYLLRKLTRDLLAFRIVTLILGAVLLVFSAPQVANWLEMPWLSFTLRFYSTVLVFEGLARFTDQLFDSLLLQGYSQISILARNGLRLAGLVLFGGRFFFVADFDLNFWIAIEAAASCTGALLSICLLWSSLKTPVGAAESVSAGIDYQRIGRYALPAYLSQIVGLAQGPDVVKLLVARLADAVQTGAFGFAAAINGMLQRYLPVFLLIGMVRPLFISAREQGRSNAELVGLASLVFKLNVFILAPATALVAIMGDRISLLLSGGKFPEAGVYLLALLILLVFQVLHTVLGLLALVVEESRAGLTGSVAGLAGIAGGVAVFPLFGPLALCAGLIASEILWCLVMQRALSRHAMAFATELKGMFKFALSAGVAAFSLWLLEPVLPVVQGIAIPISAAVVAAVFLGLAHFLKPFLENERDLINRALPRPLFVW